MVSQYRLSTDRLLLVTTPLITYPNTADKHKHMQTSSILHSHCKPCISRPSPAHPAIRLASFPVLALCRRTAHPLLRRSCLAHEQHPQSLALHTLPASPPSTRTCPAHSLMKPFLTASLHSGHTSCFPVAAAFSVSRPSQAPQHQCPHGVTSLHLTTPGTGPGGTCPCSMGSRSLPVLPRRQCAEARLRGTWRTEAWSRSASTSALRRVLPCGEQNVK
jgi:hypothetical protein